MKKLWTWPCLLVLLAQFACMSETDANGRSAPASVTAPAPAPGGKSDDADEEPSDGAGAESLTTSKPAAPPGAPAAASTPSTGSGALPVGTAPVTPVPSSSASSAAPPAGDASGFAATPGSAGASASPSAMGGAIPPASGGSGQVQAGTLTAGAWDDNLNFERFKRYRADLLKQQLQGVLASTDDEHAAAREEFSQRSAHDTLDVLLMIDTTGSMGDEISYLQAEFVALSSAIEAKYPNAKQRWSLIVYRDQGDTYVTRLFDFRESASEFRDQLAGQFAGGGGDFPEAPDAAFDAMKQLTWRSDEKTARLVFWVADAPHHNERAAAMLEGIRGAKRLGVHVYPVASSGIDELTELTMRTSAQLTGGRYVFLTDDSGVGGAHKEPSIPCYFVTRLDHAILRMVDVELTGQHVEPNMDTIIRTSGEPKDGKCSLSSGDTVAVF